MVVVVVHNCAMSEPRSSISRRLLVDQTNRMKKYISFVRWIFLNRSGYVVVSGLNRVIELIQDRDKLHNK